MVGYIWQHAASRADSEHKNLQEKSPQMAADLKLSLSCRVQMKGASFMWMNKVVFSLLSSW